EALHHVGVDPSPGNRWNWRGELDRLGENRLVLVVNAHRAGRTRTSSEPKRLLNEVVGDFSGSKVGVVVHTTPGTLPYGADIAFSLPDRGAAETAWPTPVRALALAQLRVVPLRIWGELTAALGRQPVTEATLHRTLEDFPDQLVSGEHGVMFADECLAEQLRHATDSEDITRVNRHIVEWLQQISSEFRHPEGWATS